MSMATSTSILLLLCIFLCCQRRALGLKGFLPRRAVLSSYSNPPFQTFKQVVAIGLTSLSFTSASLFLSCPSNPTFLVAIAKTDIKKTSKSAFDALKEARNELKTVLKSDPNDEIYERTKGGLKKLLSKSNVLLSLKIINKPEVKITQYKSAVVHGLAAIEFLENEDFKGAEKELSEFISIIKEKEAKAERAAMYIN